MTTQGNGTMTNEGTKPEDIGTIESIKGDEIGESLGVVEETSPDYVEDDDVVNAMAEGNY